MTTVSRPFAPIVSLALLLGPAGCRDDHEDDRHHDHAEHVDPDHWPDDFPDAVARLIDGHAATREALSAGRVDEELDGLLYVQRDLAKWLPEVAADSDMPEGPWGRVDALAARLLAAYGSAIADLDAGRPVGSDRLASAGPDLDDLRRLRDEADPAWFPGPGQGPGVAAEATDEGPGVAGVTAEGDASGNETGD